MFRRVDRRIREKYTRTGGGRTERPAKKKAMLCLTEKSCDKNNTSDEENIVPSPPRRVQSKKTGSKRKGVLCPSETSSNGENIMGAPSFLAKRRKTARTSRLASAPVFTRRRGQGVSNTGESERETAAPKLQKIQAKTKVDSNVHIRSAGRFVTRRRRVASTRPPSARVSLLNSSEDFTSGPFGASVNQQPSRRRRFLPAFGLSSAESSVNAATNTNPFREISLNELAENSLGPVPSKPIFCSTPSAPNFNKQKHPKFSSQVASPPSALGSSIGVLSTFQEDPDSLRQPGSLYVEKLQKESSLHYNEEQSLDLFPEPDRRGCSGKAKRHRGDLEGNKSATVNLLSADSDSSSLFVSAAGGLEWLIEGLKERCLSQTCRVQLQRLNILSMTQLYSQTTYSSCLEQSGPETKGSPPFAEGIQTVGFCSEGSAHPSVSVTTDKTRGHVQSVIDCDTSASVSDCHIVNFSKSPELSDRNTNRESSESVIYVVDTQSSYENIMDTQLPGGNAAPTQLTDEEAKTAKSKCTKKCFVRIKNLPLSQLHDHGFTQCKGVGVVCSLNHLEKMRGMVLLTESEHNPEAKTESDFSDEAAALTSVPKEKCLTSKAVVKAKRISLSELIEILQPKGGGPKSSTDVSDSSSDNQTKTDSECSEDTTSLKIASKSSSSASSGKKVEKSGRSVPKRNKRSLAAKERRRGSPSADRTGTTRKACVSGMSVNRWKNKEAAGALAFRSRDGKQLSTSTAVDCSISELNSKQHNQPKKLLGAAVNFFTPLRTRRLNLSSLLADLTPSTHTWSRLKAALSVHQKNMVQLTPRSLDRSVMCTPGRTTLADISQDLFATPRRTPLPKRLQSQLLSQHSLSVCEDLDLTDAEKVYAECGQQCPLSWEECILPHRMKRCVKIGEGTFGEVFSTINDAGDMVALKVIPVEGSEKVNGEDQKTFGEILHEIIISKELSSLKENQQNQTHGFIGLKDLHCVQGCYPPDLLKAWDAFDHCKGSENDRPDFFEKDQLFIILEFEFGGVDLENSNGILASLVVAKSILHQVTAALAVAEQELHFEHRDLHWGNVLVKTTEEKMGSFLLDGTAHSVETKGVLVRIIDYSLSRLEIDDLTVSCDISNDEELFMGQGDYQFEIYRLMRQDNGNEWSSYHPHTNVLWLHYLCSKLLSMKYRSVRGRGTKDARKELTRFSDDVLHYGSARDVLQNCPMFQ
ncbi:uncharacterized protein haspin isoform X3 [Girardinichthys multiradiatus]|uniref:uncharacterized protein haspin isoform X3 n=1 Tax=Girardinichthys multiradiatus TaxID=208333 RepID=UPI001FACCBD2|nr:uncharacterized protein haspin isoform X3 [Girardinichthys multiradiatus]